MGTATKMSLAAAGFILLCAWTTKKEKQIRKAEWLIGTWVNKTPKGNIYESWARANDTLLIGKSYVLKEKDTIVFETISLVQEQDRISYIPVVKDQNGGLPVRFTLKTISDEQLVFENQQHDFPQIISYIRISDDSLMAEISGTKNGHQRKQAFPMSRVQ